MIINRKKQITDMLAYLQKVHFYCNGSLLSGSSRDFRAEKETGRARVHMDATVCIQGNQELSDERLLLSSRSHHANLRPFLPSSITWASVESTAGRKRGKEFAAAP